MEESLVLGGNLMD